MLPWQALLIVHNGMKATIFSNPDIGVFAAKSLCGEDDEKT
jgi:hypothetical protein